MLVAATQLLEQNRELLGPFLDRAQVLYGGGRGRCFVGGGGGTMVLRRRRRLLGWFSRLVSFKW